MNWRFTLSRQVQADLVTKPAAAPTPPPESPMLLMIRRQRLARIVQMNALEREVREDERWISYLERHPEALEFAEFIAKIPQKTAESK